MLSLDTDVLYQLNADNSEYCYIVDIPSYSFTNHGSGIVVNEVMYASSASLLKFSPTKQSQELNLNTYSLDLSNVSNTIAKEYALESQRGKPVVISLVMLAGNTVLGSPVILYRGTLDSYIVKETAGTSTLTLKITSFWASYNQKTGRYTSDTLQQTLHTGDRFFKHAHRDLDSLGWGKR